MELALGFTSTNNGSFDLTAVELLVKMQGYHTLLSSVSIKSHPKVSLQKTRELVVGTKKLLFTHFMKHQPVTDVFCVIYIYIPPKPLNTIFNNSINGL